MTPLDTWLDGLIDAMPPAVGDPVTGDGIGIVDLHVELPVEARVDGQGLHVTTPRGRMVTGFDPPLGRIRMRVRREDA